ncbi:hypothetical protein IL410_24555, partial [Escherichia coli]|nr:hypothetical protein [Escherichia coli]
RHHHGHARAVHEPAVEVATFAISAALVTGTLLGIQAATQSTGWERAILIMFDVVSSFPSLVLALAVVAVFGPSTFLVMVIVAVTLV